MFALFALVAFGLACGGESRVGGSPPSLEALEAEAQSIDESIICPSCPGKTIGQAQVEQASQMRRLVREKLAQGWSREQILDYFSERYEGVLAEPPKEGFTLLAWLLPIVGMAGGGTALYFVVRAMRRKPEQPVVDADVAIYLDRVDQDLGRSPSAEDPVTPPPNSEDV